MQWEVGLELGETCVRVATRTRGVALSIPSLCALRGNEVTATGEEALALEGRAPSGVRFARPIESGRIAEPALVSLWIGRIIEEYIGRLRRRVALVIPPEMPPADRAILRQAVAGADAQCGFIESDLAAAFGARGDLLAPEGVLLIDAGAGSIRASLISYGRVVARRVLPYGMRRIDEDIVAALREGRGFSVGSRTAEELKQQLGSAIPGRSLYIKAAGLNHLTGFPGEIEVEAAIVEGAVRPVAAYLARARLMYCRTVFSLIDMRRPTDALDMP